MKKSLIFILLIVCIFVSGCTKVKLNTTWDNKTTITNSEITELFEKASKNYGGVTFKPIALLGTQIVAGTNYMFLCEGTTMTEEPTTSWRIVIIYKDLSDNVNITSAEELDIDEYFKKDNDFTQEMLAGGWSINENITPVELSKDASDAFNNATKGLEGATYFPITLLGSADKSYLVLSKKTLVLQNPITTLSILTIDNNKLTNIYDLDISEFNK